MFPSSSRLFACEGPKRMQFATTSADAFRVNHVICQASGEVRSPSHASSARRTPQCHRFCLWRITQIAGYYRLLKTNPGWELVLHCNHQLRERCRDACAVLLQFSPLTRKERRRHHLTDLKMVPANKCLSLRPLRWDMLFVWGRHDPDMHGASQMRTFLLPSPTIGHVGQL